jgi:hypothetical protein
VTRFSHTAKECERLELPAGHSGPSGSCGPAHDQDGTPVEVNEMIADASAYMLRYEFDT